MTYAVTILCASRADPRARDGKSPCLSTINQSPTAEHASLDHAACAARVAAGDRGWRRGKGGFVCPNCLARNLEVNTARVRVGR